MAARTISLTRAQKLAAQHSTTLARLFMDYPPLRAAVLEHSQVADHVTADSRVPLHSLIVALGY
jgi:hypothetical protein